MWVFYIYSPYCLNFIIAPLRSFTSNITLVLYALLLALDSYI